MLSGVALLCAVAVLGDHHPTQEKTFAEEEDGYYVAREQQKQEEAASCPPTHLLNGEGIGLYTYMYV